MHAVYNSKHCTLRLYRDIKSRYEAATENAITFIRYWFLIKRTTNSAGIRANWINCVLYKVLLNLHIFPVLNIYCTETYLGQVQRSYVYFSGGGGYSIYPWVGRCGAAPHTLTLFKTNIADFPTLFKTEFRFLIPCLRQKLINRYPD